MNNNGQNKLFFFFTPPKINNHINTENETSNKKEVEETEKNYYFGNTDKEEIGKGFIHYTTAVACAANKKYGITHYLGACDKEKVIPDIENDLKEKSHAENIRWAKYNENINSDEILKSIFSNIDLSDCSEIIIAINSGIRNNVMFFSVISQIMSYRGINIRLLYVKKFDDNNEHIIDVTEQNKYFDVLRAVELFTETGNPKKLKEQYKDEKELDTLFNYMDRFYKSIQVCRPVNNSENSNISVLDIYDDMIKEIDRLIQNSENADIPVIMQFLLPEIKKRFAPDDNKDSFLQIVEWCQNNGMITIAFFILDAEITRYIQNKNLLDVNYPKSKDEFRDYISRASNYSGTGTTPDLSLLIQFSVLNISYNINRNINKSNKSVLNKFGIKFSDEALTVIMIHELIRRTRNSMAHSDIFTGILGTDEYRSLTILTDKYQKKCKSVKLYPENKSDILKVLNKKNNKVSNSNLIKIGKEITITQENAYEKYESLLKCILNDLKKAENQKRDNNK